MEDQQIVDMYWARSEEAIAETEKKYGRYCHTISYNILHSNEDAEECVNDTYLAAWDSMPPSRPGRLAPYLGRITRNISLNRYHHEHAQKRSAPITVILDEAEEFIPDPASEAPISDEIALRDAINSFMRTLTKRTRIIFVRRYWYFSPIAEIAEDLCLSQTNVKVILLRTRDKFKAHLEKEGIIV